MKSETRLRIHCAITRTQLLLTNSFAPQYTSILNDPKIEPPNAVERLRLIMSIGSGSGKQREALSLLLKLVHFATTATVILDTLTRIAPDSLILN